MSEILKSIRRHSEPQRKPAVCETHGDFESVCFMGRLWSSCPTCAAEREAEKKAEADRLAERARQAQWQQRIDKACIPYRFIDRTLESYEAVTAGQARALKFAKDYANGFDDVLKKGRCALFLGKPGTGKNHLAVGICLQVMRKSNATALFVTVMRAVRRVKDSWSRESALTETQAVRSLTSPDLLVLDEVGVQYGSDSEKLILFDVLNERYEQRLPTILLSNLSLDEVRAYLGDRVFDRLREDGGAVVVFDWASHRGSQPK